MAMANLLRIDGHVHQESIPGIDDMLRIMNDCGLSAVSIVSTPSRRPAHLTGNPVALLTKALHPERFFVFGGLNYCSPAGVTKQELARQAEQLIAAGCDGIKMIEGKPTARKATGLALDAEVYDGYYGFLQEHRIPLTFHVSDPETWWDPNLAPVIVKEKDQGYWNKPDILSKEELYAEAEGVLKKFPDLPVIFAHFFFLSDFPDRAAATLDRWPAISFDLAPGPEMYRNFSKCPEVWRDFFIKHQDRIVFGTDNITPEPNPEARHKVKVDKTRWIYRFLETDDTFEGMGGTLRGLKLPENALAKICAGNYQRLAGQKPKATNLPKTIALARSSLDIMAADKNAATAQTELKEILRRLEQAGSKDS